ncbi:MAG: UbiA-like polyprenyltransferase [Planctomycetota bacterium]|nr:UbiA-like polyprenyltransferase [Planctomycetota bacterium]
MPKKSGSSTGRVQKVLSILEMIRFSHTIFALPFALLAAVMCWVVEPNKSLGEPVPDFRPIHLLGIVVCMVFARSAAMAFNRVVDREIDKDNPRTQNRHLPAGILSLKSVVVFTLINSGLFVAATLLFLPNPLPVYLSVPVLGFLFLYSYTKRFTSLAHFYLGISLMLAPISTWIALRGEVMVASPADCLPAVVIGLIVLFWVGGFDIIYACQDAVFDQEAKLKSVPAKLGVKGALRIAGLSHLAMIGCMLLLPQVHHAGGSELDLGWIYYTAVASVAVLLIYEHSMVNADDLTRVNIAFFNVNSVISVGLFLIVSLDLLI